MRCARLKEHSSSIDHAAHASSEAPRQRVGEPKPIDAIYGETAPIAHCDSAL